MNIAFYDMLNDRLDHLPASPGMTPQELRQFSIDIQVCGITEGQPVHGILVGWEDAPEGYLGVFMLGDMVDHPLPPTVLDRIKQLVRRH